jgi:hypothetical protein
VALSSIGVSWPTIGVTVLMLVASLGGCGKSTSGGVSVHGKVSFRGTPLDKAALTFFPTSGRPIGASVAGGEYETELMPGEYVAVVDVAAELPPGFREGDPVPPPKVVLPDLYTSRAKSPLKAVVTAGQDAPIDFDLK